MLTSEDLRFCIAPMMEWTDRHCRFFHRILSRRARLYTEMVTAAAVIHGPRERLLGFSPQEHPVAVQLGGSDPAELAQAARICTEEGYDEINLNVGCPSDRVQDGRFGACLMREPALVADCVASMKVATPLPITVKCRIGVDEQDPEEALGTLTEALVQAGIDGLVVHARKAWLKGLSPKENRDIPPLDYKCVHGLKQTHSSLPIVINGGLKTLSDCKEHLSHVDGVMVGRAAYHDPEWLLQVDREIFGDSRESLDAFQVMKILEPYIAARLAEGVPLSRMTRHLLGLFAGRCGARAFRRILTTESVKPGAGLDVLHNAVARLQQSEASLCTPLHLEALEEGAARTDL